MTTFNVTYFNAAKTIIDSESIFMKSLATAKRSALTHAPDNTHYVEITDLLSFLIAQYNINDGWTSAD